MVLLLYFFFFEYLVLILRLIFVLILLPLDFPLFLFLIDLATRHLSSFTTYGIHIDLTGAPAKRTLGGAVFFSVEYH